MGRRAEMGSDAREEEETEGMFEMSTDAWPRPVEDAESDEDADDDVSVCPLFTADGDETLPKRNLLSWFSAAPTLPKKRSMPNMSVDGDESGEEPRQLPTARSGPGGATAAELAWERTARRLGSGDGVFSPEPGRALATRGGGFDETDSESESDFEDVPSSDDEDESRGDLAGFEAETGGTSVEGLGRKRRVVFGARRRGAARDAVPTKRRGGCVFGSRGEDTPLDRRAESAAFSARANRASHSERVVRDKRRGGETQTVTPPKDARDAPRFSTTFATRAFARRDMRDCNTRYNTYDYTIHRMRVPSHGRFEPFPFDSRTSPRLASSSKRSGVS